MSRGRRINKLAERYREQGEIVAWSSLGQALNDRESQAEISHGLAGRFSSVRPAEIVKSTLEKEGFSPDAFSSFIQGAASFPHLQPVDMAEAVTHLNASPLRGIVARHLIEEGGRFHLLFYLHYRGPAFNQPPFSRTSIPSIPLPGPPAPI